MEVQSFSFVYLKGQSEGLCLWAETSSKLGVGFSQHDYRLVGVEFLDGFHQLFALCETVIRACSLDGEWVRRRHREGHFVGPEAAGKSAVKS